MDYFKQRRAFRKLLTEELDLSLGQICLYRELLDYANDEGTMENQFRIRNSVLASRTGLSEEGVKAARNRLVQEDLIKYEPGKKNKVKPGYKLVQLYREYPNRGKDSTSTSTVAVPQPTPIPVPQPVPHKYLLVPDKDKTKKTTRHQSAKRTYAEGSQEYILAIELWGRIKRLNPEAKEPDLQKWADSIRLMHERDGRDWNKIAAMIRWSQADDFWRANILSAAALRKHYDKMAAKANAEAEAAKKPKQSKFGHAARVEQSPDWLQKREQPKPAQRHVSKATLEQQMAKLHALQNGNHTQSQEASAHD